MATKGLRFFSKLTCFSTLCLVFIGGMVTSTGSGLAVPDWPLSYGTWFPPMIGGVFYEHGHRMAASVIGFLTLTLSIWIALKEKRKWLKALGFTALGAVICQGILGGITVLFYLPDAVSVGHAVLAQTFFILTIIIAYILSNERQQRELNPEGLHQKFLQVILAFIVCIYLQLIIGAIMRHTASGLAIPDFPKMGGEWIPRFDEQMLGFINDWRFDHDLEAVTIAQVSIHFIHRLGACIILLMLCLVNYVGLKYDSYHSNILKTLYMLDIAVGIQITLGILTVLTGKSPVLTSFHVVTGAGVLGLSVLLFLRVAPLSIKQLKLIGSYE